ncbi:MAG: dihydroorotate dehydrogenase electron transfer subunit [Candidatus Margulisbacteria bacterium]|nr:dihydroorotate dehydrogenase electron transfer subunit [Candidatus Margulisiibacteriota bacterium]
MPIQEKCRILDHQKVGSSYFKLTLVSPYISSHAKPGQFVEVKCSDSYEPLLRRPISIHRISAEHKTFELLYEVVGKGTGLLAACSIGGELDILGPLGEGFRIVPKKQVHLLVGGGLGVAPLLALAETLKSLGEKAVYILIGAKTKECVHCETEFNKVTDQVLVSTDDGTHGKKGLISDLLLDFLNNQLSTFDFQLSTIYACGSKVMLKAVAEIASQKKIDCQLSMEERMACGIGACKGCAIKTTSGYKMVCKDGPVFDAKEIVWT